MATTEVLRAHNVLLLPASQRQARTVSAAAHRSRRPAGSNSTTATARRSSPPVGTSAPKGSRRHRGSKARPAAEVYAGPAFSTSPEPSSLPLPHFPAKKQAALVDDDATRGLRRILRLD
ncbi:hypothetical protein BS78_07G196300 [Paspalum vaginatum]|nr:hypothetical protein BS78_07G196300 [Paspalum vaginatum]